MRGIGSVQSSPLTKCVIGGEGGRQEGQFCRDPLPVRYQLQSNEHYILFITLLAFHVACYLWCSDWPKLHGWFTDWPKLHGWVTDWHPQTLPLFTLFLTNDSGQTNCLEQWSERVFLFNWATLPFNWSGEKVWNNSVQHCWTHSSTENHGSAHALRYGTWKSCKLSWSNPVS